MGLVKVDEMPAVFAGEHKEDNIRIIWDDQIAGVGSYFGSLVVDYIDTQWQKGYYVRFQAVYC